MQQAGVPRVRRPPREHLEDEHAVRPVVGAHRVAFAAQHLGRRRERRADHRAGAAAVGVVLSAGAARVVVRDDRGVVGVAGSCRCDLRTRTAPGADLARATRTVRLEVVAGAPLLENGEAFPQPGFARLTVVAARRAAQERQRNSQQRLPLDTAVL